MTEHTDPRQISARSLTVSNAVLVGSTVAAPSIPGVLNIGNSPSAPLVSIDLGTGRITYGPGYDPDEAARLFWDTITRQHTAPDRYFGQPLTEAINRQLRAGETAEKQVRRLDEMAEAWKALPDTVRTATVVDAVHTVTRPDGARP